jgi:hypothetical protein
MARAEDNGFRPIDGGAVFLDSFPDWYGTGEECRLYRLALR